VIEVVLENGDALMDYVILVSKHLVDVVRLVVDQIARILGWTAGNHKCREH